MYINVFILASLIYEYGISMLDNMMSAEQLDAIKLKLSTIKEKSPFYREKYKDIDPTKIQTKEDFEKLPLTDKCELRDAYPLGLQSVPDEEVVRIHSSSGTTGKPVIIPYTNKDVEDWAIMFERCYKMAGVTNLDRIHITPGYGLWTAGIGFQAGAERLGAMCIPMGPGNTEKQLTMMQDAGGEFMITPNVNADLIRDCVRRGLVAMPGALTPSEAVTAHDAGASFVKIFPAGSLGPGYVKALVAPLAHIPFLAVGGVTSGNAADFMKAGCIGVGAGGDLTNKAWIAAGAWEKITDAARRLADAVRNAD